MARSSYAHLHPKRCLHISLSRAAFTGASDLTEYAVRRSSPKAGRATAVFGSGFGSWRMCTCGGSLGGRDVGDWGEELLEDTGEVVLGRC